MAEAAANPFMPHEGQLFRANSTGLAGVSGYSGLVAELRRSAPGSGEKPSP
ncbi:MAG: hypothetical protein ACO1OX_11475 [Novosphingobium sp.]